MKFTEEIKSNKRNYMELIFLCICIGIITLLFYSSSRPMEPVHMAVAVVLLFIGSRNLYRNREMVKGKRELTGVCILALSLACMTVVGGKISIAEWVFHSMKGADIIWGVLYWVVYVILFANLLILIRRQSVSNLFVNIKEIGGENIKNNIGEFRRMWFLYACILIIFWTPVFFVYFPGIVAEDSTISIAMFLKEMPWDNHFPVFYSLILGGLVQLGQVLGNSNIGVALYSALQLSVMAAGLGYFLAWMLEKGVRKLYIYASIAFFASAPLFGNYAIVMWKDPVFSLLLLFMVLFLYEHVAFHREAFLERRNMIKFIVLSIGICLMRNNGIYIIVLISTVLLVLYRKQWKRALITCGVSIAVSMIITGPIYQAAFSAENLFVESIGIPLQQMVRVVVTGGEMTEEQRQYMDGLLPLEQYQEVYNPYLVDPVKWATDFDNHFLEENKEDFFKTWLGMLRPNFKTYVEAYLMETLSFWRIGEEIPYELVKTYITNNSWGIFSFMPVERLTGHQIIETLNQKYDFIPTAIPIWIVFMNMLYCFILRKSRYIVPLLPLVGTWLTMMVATPTAFGLRYVFIYVLALPFALVYMWMVDKN